MAIRKQPYTGRGTPDLHSSSARGAISQLTPMLKHLLIPAIALAPFAFTAGCGSDSKNTNSSAVDANGDGLADDLGSLVDANGDGVADTYDINNDGIPDGPKVDVSGKGSGPFGVALDEDCN